jgi:hypothetical protein
VTGIADRRFAVPLGAYVLIGGALIALQALILYAMGRVPICTCGYVKLWHGIVQSSENSQHIFDWYTFSHILHGFAFYWLMRALIPAGPVGLWLVLSVAFESFWEVLENTSFIIERYRAATISLAYYGDSIVNSVADNAAMVLGFAAAYRLPVWALIGIAAAVEASLLWWIRDNLTLNIVMLLYPLPGIRAWQAGGGGALQ